MEKWNEGLCRELTKAIGSIIDTYQVENGHYDLYKIGFEVTQLYNELFSE